MKTSIFPITRTSTTRLHRGISRTGWPRTPCSRAWRPTAIGALMSPARANRCAWKVNGFGEFFGSLQVNATLGRVFTAEEDRPSTSHVVVISDSLWRSRFASDLRVLGQKVFLDDQGYEVIGVMPPRFHFPDPDDQLWVPLALTPDELINRGSHYLNVFARLKLSVTLAQAQTEMNLIARRLTQLYPQSNTGQTVDVVPLQEDIAGPVRPALLVLVGAVTLVL